MKLIIDDEVYQKVMYWVDRAKDLEVSGLGLIQVEPDGVFRVTDAMLLPQKNTKTHTEISPDGVAKAMYDLRNSGGELKWWWHSHVDMGVFWSKTDTDTIEEFGQGGWVVATVFNKRREKKTAFYSVDGTVTPFGKSSLFIDDLETEIKNTKHIESWEKDYVDNVDKITNAYLYKTPNYSAWWEDQYPGYDPNFLTKKEYKKLKKAAILQDKVNFDDYGFDQSEREFLQREGYDISVVDNLVNSDITPVEILQLAEFGFNSNDVIEQVKMGEFHKKALLDELKEMSQWKDLNYEN